MNELQRAEYLSALGVTSYMPRFRLPLAPEPVQAPLPPAPESAEPQAPSAAALIASVAASETGNERAMTAHAQTAALTPPKQETRPAPEVGRVIGSITAETKIAEVPKPLRVAPPAQAVNPFVLNCWWLGEELLAIDSREPGVALPVDTLFGNIARALGWHQLAVARDKLRWPLAENPFAAAAGAEDARDTCSSWLEAACARQPVKSIWLMGAQAQEFCSPVALDGKQDEMVAEWQGAQVIAMPSLSDLLTEPERKRDLWQLLRKLYPAQTRRG